MASLLCGLARYSLYYSHWTDILAGYVIGVVIAVYVVSPPSHSCSKTTTAKTSLLPKVIWEEGLSLIHI